MSLVEFRLPDIGEGIAEAEVLEWMVTIGQKVDVNDGLVVIQTDKASLELPSPTAGVIVTLAAEPGEIVPIGAPLVVIEGEALEDGAIETTPTAVADERETKPLPPAGSSTRVLASPVVRKFAHRLGVDLATVPPGPDGRVTRAAVEAAANGQATPARAETPSVVRVPPERDDRTEPLRGLRRRVAEAMTRSWQEIPHITEFREIRAAALIDAHSRLKAHLGDTEHLTLMPLFVRAVSAALRDHPRFNATLDMDKAEVTYRARLGIGIATAAPEGLMVPVLRDPDQKSLIEIGREIRELSEAARGASITLDQIQGGTFTISNFGTFGTWLGTPIIRQGEVGIVGFGRVRESVVVVDGAPAVTTVLPVAVSTDHRMNDGEHLARFVDSLERYLVNPVLLLASG